MQTRSARRLRYLGGAEVCGAALGLVGLFWEHTSVAPAPDRFEAAAIGDGLGRAVLVGTGLGMAVCVFLPGLLLLCEGKRALWGQVAVVVFVLAYGYFRCWDRWPLDSEGEPVNTSETVFRRQGTSGYIVPPDTACRVLRSEDCWEVHQADIDAFENAMPRKEAEEVRAWTRQYIGVRRDGAREMLVVFLCPNGPEAAMADRRVGLQLVEVGDCYREAWFGTGRAVSLDSHWPVR